MHPRSLFMFAFKQNKPTNQSLDLSYLFFFHPFFSSSLFFVLQQAVSISIYSLYYPIILYLYYIVLRAISSARVFLI